MPITVPTFSDGQVLTAAQLNQLVDAINLLSSIATGQNVPFIGWNHHEAEGNHRTYHIRHRSNNLFVQFNVGWDLGANDVDLDWITIKFNGTTVYSNGTPAVNQTSANVNLAPFGLILGSMYRVDVDFLMKNDGGQFSFQYMAETDSAV